MKEIYPSLWVYEQSFCEPKYIYEKLEKFIDNNVSFNWSWAQTSDSDNSENIQNSYRTNKSFGISGNKSVEEIKLLDDLIFNGTTGSISEYAQHYQLGVLTDEGYSVLKYENGTMYKKHHDCGGANSNRVVSMLVYLNDDFVGGELEFPNIGIFYKPKPGDILLFPSNYTFAHIAHPVTSGTKYAVVSWLSYGN